MLDLTVQQLSPEKLGLEFGSGAVIGLVMGFAAKKIAKIVVILVGLELALFKFLESKGILVVDWERLSGGFVEAGGKATDPGWIEPLLSTFSVGAGFTGGFFLGFKKG